MGAPSWSRRRDETDNYESVTRSWTRQEFLDLSADKQAAFGKTHVWSTAIEQYLFAPEVYVKMIRKREAAEAKRLTAAPTVIAPRPGLQTASGRTRRRFSKAFLNRDEVRALGMIDGAVPLRWRDPNASALYERGGSYLHVRPGLCGVYFIEASGLALVKIGMSKDVRARILALDSAIPTDVSIMAVVLARDVRSARELELAMHARFAQHRRNRHSEWFHLNEEIVRFATNVDPMSGKAPIGEES